MEVLSGVASCFAVVSLAVQLADKVKDVYDFWHSVREAPGSIRVICNDLKILSDVLLEIGRTHKEDGPTSITMNALAICKGHVSEIEILTNKLRDAFGSSSGAIRGWASVKTVFKQDKINSLQFLLQQTKTTLTLALQASSRNYMQQQMRDLSSQIANLQLGHPRTSQPLMVPTGSGATGLMAIFRREVQRMTAKEQNPLLRSGLERMMELAIDGFVKSVSTVAVVIEADDLTESEPHQHSLAREPHILGPSILNPSKQRRVITDLTSTKTENIFGLVLFKSRQFCIGSSDDLHAMDCDHTKDETEVHFIIRPARWLVELGLNYEFRVTAASNSNSWTNTIESFRLRSDDSLGFSLCQSGNLRAVQLLFERGEASVLDIDSYGESLLHYAARSMNLDLCKFLLSAGAKKELRSIYDFTSFGILFAVWESSPEPITLEKLISLFGALIDFEEPEEKIIDNTVTDEFTYSIRRIYENTNKVQTYADSLELFMWLVREVSANTILSQRRAFRVLNYANLLGDQSSFTSALAISGHSVDVSYSGYSNYLASLSANDFITSLIFAENGADLNFMGLDTIYSPVLETPISVALKSNISFRIWKEMNKRLKVDIESLICQKLDLSLLYSEGWNKVTIMVLLSSDLPFPEPHSSFDITPPCCICGELLHKDDSSPMELNWQCILEDVKLGTLTRSLSATAYGSWVKSFGKREDDSNETSISTEETVKEIPKVLYSNEYLEENLWLCSRCWYGCLGGERIRIGAPQIVIEKIREKFSKQSQINRPVEEDSSDDDEYSPMLLRI